MAVQPMGGDSTTGVLPDVVEAHLTALFTALLADADPLGSASTAQSAATAAAATDAAARIVAHIGATDPHGDRAYTTAQITALINGAPGVLDTLGEIAAQLATDSAVNISDVGNDGVLIVGQSNARGAGTAYDATFLDPIDPRIKAWPGGGVYLGVEVSAVEPMSHVDFGIATAPPGVGPGIPFARQWVKRIPVNRGVTLIDAAFSGTPFEGNDSKGSTRQWKVTGSGNTLNLWTNAVALAQSWLAQNANNRIVAALWIHGEQDGSNGTASTLYTTDLDALIDAFHTQFGATVPFILGQMTPETVALSGFHTAINALTIDTPRRKTYTGFAYGLGLGNTDPVNGALHWSAKAQRSFGPSMYDAYLRANGNVVGAAPIATTAPVVTQNGGSAVTISWAQATGRVTGYVVETNIGSGWSIATRSATLIDAKQAVTGLPVGSTVQARVSTVNEQGTSAASPVGTLAIVVLTIPNAPTSLAAGTPTYGTVPLSWTAPTVDVAHAAATGYTIQTSINSGSTWTTAGTAAASPYTVTGLTASTAYTFRVLATNTAGTGAASSSASATTADPPAQTYTSTDAFTGTAGTLVSAHTPDTGPAWAKNASLTGTMVIDDAGRIRTADLEGAMYYINQAASGTQLIEADMTFVSMAAGTQLGIAARMSTSAISYYALRWVVNNNQWSISKTMPGPSTLTLATYTPTTLPVVGDTIHMTFLVNGITLTGTIADGHLTGGSDSTLTITDSAIATGRPGVAGAGVNTDSTGLRLDNYAANA